MPDARVRRRLAVNGRVTWRPSIRMVSCCLLLVSGSHQIESLARRIESALVEYASYYDEETLT